MKFGILLSLSVLAASRSFPAQAPASITASTSDTKATEVATPASASFSGVGPPRPSDPTA